MRNKTGTYQQALGDLDSVPNDSVMLSKCLEKFKIDEKNVHNFEGDQKSKEVEHIL